MASRSRRRARPLGGELAQDARDFALLLGQQLAPAVPHLDGLQRFDEHGRAGGGDVVHDARQLRALLRLDRDDITPVAQSDDRLLDGGARGVEDLVETRVQPVVDDARLSPQLDSTGDALSVTSPRMLMQRPISDVSSRKSAMRPVISARNGRYTRSR